MEQKSEFTSNRDAIGAVNDRLDIQRDELEHVQAELHDAVVRTADLRFKKEQLDQFLRDEDPEHLRRCREVDEERLSRHRSFDQKAELEERELRDHIAKQKAKLNELRLQKTQFLCDISTLSSDCDHYREKLKKNQLKKANLEQQVHHSQLEYETSVSQLAEKQTMLASMRNVADQLSKNLDENIRQFQALSFDAYAVDPVTFKPSDVRMKSPSPSIDNSAEATEGGALDVDLAPEERAELDAVMVESPPRSAALSTESGQPLCKKRRLSPRESSSSPSPSPPPPSPGRGLPTSQLPRIP